MSKISMLKMFKLFFAFLSLIFFLAGTISWIRSTGAEFNDCDSGVCARDGPKLSLAILVIFFVSLKFYLCMACSLYYKRRFKELGRNKEVLGEAKVFIGTAQLQNNIVMPPAVANSQSMPKTGVLSQFKPVSGQSIYPQGVTPGLSYPVKNSYNPNINDGKNKNLVESDLTVLDNSKNIH